MILAAKSAGADVRAWRSPLRAPVTRSRAAIERLTQHRREHLWAWLSLITLIVCWDASLRLDEHVSIPKPRLQHAVERDDRDEVMTVMEMSR